MWRVWVCLRSLFALKKKTERFKIAKANIWVCFFLFSCVCGMMLYQHNWSEYLNRATGNNSHLSKIENIYGLMVAGFCNVMRLNTLIQPSPAHTKASYLCRPSAFRRLGLCIITLRECVYIYVNLSISNNNSSSRSTTSSGNSNALVCLFRFNLCVSLLVVGWILNVYVAKQITY